MELLNIRKAFEKSLKELNSDIDTAYENVKYEPRSNVPYQRLQLAPNQVQNPTIGDNYYREEGEFQVFLCYPTHIGTSDVLTKAHLIRDSYYRGLTLVEGGTEIIISETPRIDGAIITNERYIVPVIIKYFASVLKA
jgi:hypothetical protein